MAWALSSTPTAPTPIPGRSVRRPVATSSASPVTSVAVGQGQGEGRAVVADGPGRGAGADLDALPAEDLGQQVARLGLLRRQQPAGALDHGNPGAESGENLGSSAPIDPPPRTTSDPGTSVASMASRLVQNGVPARPVDGRHERVRCRC